MVFFQWSDVPGAFSLEHLKVFLKGDLQHIFLVFPLVRTLISASYIASSHETSVKKCNNIPRNYCKKLCMLAFLLFEQGRSPGGHQVYSFTGSSDTQGMGRDPQEGFLSPDCCFFLKNECSALLMIKNLLSQHRRLFLSHPSTSLPVPEAHRKKTEISATRSREAWIP